MRWHSNKWGDNLMCWTFIAIQEWKDFQLPGCLQYQQLEGDGELSQQNDGRNGFLISEPSAIKESSTKKCARTKPSLQTEFKLRYHPKKKSTDMSTLSTSVAETLKKANAESQALQVPAEISRAPQKCRLLYLTTVTHRWFFTFSTYFYCRLLYCGPWPGALRRSRPAPWPHPAHSTAGLLSDTCSASGKQIP